MNVIFVNKPVLFTFVCFIFSVIFYRKAKTCRNARVCRWCVSECMSLAKKACGCQH